MADSDKMMDSARELRESSLQSAKEAITRCASYADGYVNKEDLKNIFSDSCFSFSGEMDVTAYQDEFLETIQVNKDGKVHESDWLEALGKVFDNAIAEAMGTQ